MAKNREGYLICWYKGNGGGKDKPHHPHNPITKGTNLAANPIPQQQAYGPDLLVEG